MNNNGNGFLETENLDKISKITTIDSTFRTPPTPTLPSTAAAAATTTSSSMIETNNNNHYSNEPNEIGNQPATKLATKLKPKKFLSQPTPPIPTTTTTPPKVTATATLSLSEPLSPTSTATVIENGDGGSLIKTITAEVYQQFDQLVTNNNQNQNSDSNKTNTKDFGQNKRTKTNSLSGLTKQTNQVNRRDRIKSFIEFDDVDVDDDHDDDDEDHRRRGWNYQNYGDLDQQSSSGLWYRNHQLRKSSPSLNEYRNDLINVFEPHNIQTPLNDDAIDGDDDVEWNDFQTSEPQPPPNGHQTNDGSRSIMSTGNDRNQNPDDVDNNSTTDSTNSDNSDNNYESNMEINNSDPENNMFLYGKLNKMEEEQEFLNNSLIALTSHFAQVQLRLRQIVEAKDLDGDRREQLLAELETFANRGIPELMLSTTNTNTIHHNHTANDLQRSVSMATSLMADDVFDDDDDDDDENDDGRSLKSIGTNHIDDVIMSNDNRGSDIDTIDDTIGNHHHHNSQRRFSRPRYWSYSSQMDDDSITQHSLASMSTNVTKNSTSKLLITEEKLERQRTRQKELITQLKEQLEDLERYAYETGELNSLPSSMLLERQNAIIEQLKSKLPVLSIDEIDNLTPDQLRNKVDHAIKELVNPVIMKEQLVTQLKTQVTDLERFIEFLQQGGAKMKKHKLGGGRGGGSYLMKFLKKTSSSSASKTIQDDQVNNHIDGYHNRRKKNDLDSDERNNNGNNSGAQINNRLKGATGKSGGKTRVNKTATTVEHNGRQNNGNSSAATNSADSIFKRILSLLHMFAWTQLGTCASFSNQDSTATTTASNTRVPFQQNILKKTTPLCARHWGDLRAHLEMVINSILDFYKEQNMKIYETTTTKTRKSFGNININEEVEEDQDQDDVDDDCYDDAIDDHPPTSNTLMIDNYYAYEQMTILVRKELSVALRNLIQHGMIGCMMNAANLTRDNGSDSISAMINPTIPINTVGYLLNFGLGCFNSRSGLIGPTQQSIKSRRPMHAWELILYYYELKHGNKFRSTPTRRLSQSFGLQVVSGMQINPKHSLLAAIDDIIDSHTRLKRSLDSHFKAFVSIALNQQMLSKWLRLILRNPTIITDCYEKWSYTASTGFEDALRQLDKLSELKFCLPTDLAVRQLQSIHDAF